MKKETQKKQKKAKKPDLKVKKQTVKDLDPEKGSEQIKGGAMCIPCTGSCGRYTD
jgi:heterodisulfide reductase subunit C